MTAILTTAAYAKGARVQHRDYTNQLGTIAYSNDQLTIVLWDGQDREHTISTRSARNLWVDVPTVSLVKAPIVTTPGHVATLTITHQGITVEEDYETITDAMASLLDYVRAERIMIEPNATRVTADALSMSLTGRQEGASDGMRVGLARITMDSGFAA